jgi:signal transduction histidine kinase
MFFDEMANVKNIDIDLSIGKNFNLEFSKYELERIIDNTFSNALKYSNKDTFIEIVIDSDLDNDTSTKEENFYIEIIDQGIGIENPNEIFNPYYQQKDDNKGLGLGLNIVKEICDKYEIKIEVKSQKNNTSFKYIFPNKITRELS